MITQIEVYMMVHKDYNQLNLEQAVHVRIRLSFYYTKFLMLVFQK